MMERMRATNVFLGRSCGKQSQMAVWMFSSPANCGHKIQSSDAKNRKSDIATDA